MGFTKTQIYRLWGEFFHWSLTVINLKECSNVPGKTKLEVFTSKRPDLRSIRLLPICAILYVFRHDGIPDLPVNRSFWQRGVYVGPSLSVDGAIRVAVITRGKLQIVTTTTFKAVSDGGDLDPYSIVSNHLVQLGDNAGSKPTLTDSVDPPLISSSPTVIDPIELYHSDERGDETPVQLPSATEKEKLLTNRIDLVPSIQNQVILPDTTVEIRGGRERKKQRRNEFVVRNARIRCRQQIYQSIIKMLHLIT